MHQLLCKTGKWQAWHTAWALQQEDFATLFKL